MRDLGEQRRVNLEIIRQTRRAVTEFLFVDVERVVGEAKSDLLSFCTDQQARYRTLHLS